MSRRLYVVLGGEALLLAALLAVALDQYVHAQSEMLDGLNSWGYRGAVARQRAFDETRIVMAGGTRAFDPGRPVNATTLSRVRFMVEQWVTFDRGPVTAVNLGLVDLPQGAYAERLERFRYLSPDVICLYADLSSGGSASPAPGLLARTAGYWPSLPPLATIDRRISGWFGSPQPVSDDISAVKRAAEVGLSMAPTVIAIPEPESDDESRVRDALMNTLAPFTADPRVRILQLKNGPDAIHAGVVQPAIAVQIEAAVSSLLRARPPA